MLYSGESVVAEPQNEYHDSRMLYSGESDRFSKKKFVIIIKILVYMGWFTQCPLFMSLNVLLYFYDILFFDYLYLI